jgi:hypothetical protein
MLTFHSQSVSPSTGIVVKFHRVLKLVDADRRPNLCLALFETVPMPDGSRAAMARSFFGHCAGFSPAGGKRDRG